MRDRLNQETKAALKARDKARLGALRLISAALQEREIATRTDKLSEQEVAAVLQKMLKQRRDSISQFQAGGRQDLVDQEQFEVKVLGAYMPQQLTEQDIEQAVDAVITAAGAKSAQDMGKVMAALKPQLAGRADMAKVSALVKARLVG